MKKLKEIVIEALESAEINIMLNDSEKIYLERYSLNKKINSENEAKNFLKNFFKNIETKYFDINKDLNYLKELSKLLWEKINERKNKLTEEVARNYHTAEPNPIKLSKILEDMYNEDEEPSRFEISNNVIINDNEEVYLDEKDSGNWYYLKVFNKKLK